MPIISKKQRANIDRSKQMFSAMFTTSAEAGRAYRRQANKRFYYGRPNDARDKHTRRQMAKIQRTPVWADLAAIKEIYAKAHSLGLSVDHEVPLRGKLVSGLHVEYNLRIIPLGPNLLKSNRWE